MNVCLYLIGLMHNKGDSLTNPTSPSFRTRNNPPNEQVTGLFSNVFFRTHQTPLATSIDIYFTMRTFSLVRVSKMPVILTDSHYSLQLQCHIIPKTPSYINTLHKPGWTIFKLFFRLFPCPSLLVILIPHNPNRKPAQIHKILIYSARCVRFVSEFFEWEEKWGDLHENAFVSSFPVSEFENL
jgi:hypothetical protein